MKPIEVIQATTIINAEMIGQEDSIGSIEVGKRANLLLLQENPILDLNSLLHPDVVIKNGKMFNSH